MRYKIVPVKNVARLAEAGNALIERPLGMPGMGLVDGHTGYGKTTAVTWFVTRCHGVFIRAMATSSPLSLLGSILRELDIEPRGSCAEMVERIVGKLAETRRPLLVDEADYLVEQRRLVDTLRDIHDLATVPVVMIGMAGIQRKIAAREQLSGRIAQRVQFYPLDLDDARLMARELCEVSVEDDLVEQIHAKAAGSTRLLVVGLSAVEDLAKTRGKNKIGTSDWPRERDFFIEPVRKRGVRRVA